MIEEEAFKKWMAQLRHLAKKNGWPIEDEEEPWHDYFMEGYSPARVLGEDMSYGLN